MNHKLFLLVIVLAAVMLPAGWAAADPATGSASFIPSEPNDTFATANDAFVGYLMTPTDVDYLRVELQTPTRFQPTVVIDADWDEEPWLRVEIAVYNAAQVLLAEDSDCDPLTQPAAVDVPTGLYYLRIRACDGYFDGDQVYGVNIDTYSRPIEWEPNNSRATANVLDDADATIAPAGDVDFYRVEGAAGDTFYASLSSEGGFTPEMSLLNAGGAVLAESGPGYLYYNLTADGIYYVRVQSAAHPTGSGTYRLYGEVEDSPQPGDVEPNDTPAQAVPVVYGDHLRGYISDTDVIDHYRFNGQAGDEVALALADVAFRYDAQVALYDPTMNPVALNSDGYTYWAALPANGVYTVAITVPSADYDDGFIDYDLVLVLTTGDEPNNTMATATDVPFGPALIMTHDYLCDTDWYRFQGRAGDVLVGVNTNLELENVFLYNADGDRVGHVLPADRTYYLRVDGDASDKWDTYCYEGPVNYPFGEALWVSAAVDGLGGNAAIKRGDIATRKDAAGQWQIVFDASDVGITQNVAAFERMPNGSILMSLGAAQNVPGLGKIMPHDIIRFSPTALGDTTAGTFQWFLDGSDVGLSTSGEKIDAISMQRDVEQPLRVSISGAGSVPRQSGGALKVADEDVINYVGTFGADSAGKWRAYLDGSTVPGMATEDVTAMTRIEVYPQRDSLTLLSFDSAFTIGGTQGNTFDVLLEETWLTAVQRLTDKKIDGLAVGPAWTP